MKRDLVQNLSARLDLVDETILDGKDKEGRIDGASWPSSGLVDDLDDISGCVFSGVVCFIADVGLLRFLRNCAVDFWVILNFQGGARCGKDHASASA